MNSKSGGRNRLIVAMHATIWPLHGGGVMEVGGLTVQPPCCIVAHDSDTTAWLDSHIVG